MAGQPGLNLGVLVGGVVVEHDMQLAAWIGTGNQLKNIQKLALAVSRVAGVGHLTGSHLQRGNQRRGAMPEVVMGPPLDPARPDRPEWLGAFQRLDLGLLAPRQHDRVRGGIQVQPDHVADSRRNLRIGRELEHLSLPGLDVMLRPDPSHRAVADTQLYTQQPRGPVSHPKHLRWWVSVAARISHADRGAPSGGDHGEAGQPGLR